MTAARSLPPSPLRDVSLAAAEARPLALHSAAGPRCVEARPFDVEGFVALEERTIPPPPPEGT